MAGAWPEAEGKRIKFNTVGGYFLQDEPTTDPNGFDYVCCASGVDHET
jgi:hypothetical protein